MDMDVVSPLVGHFFEPGTHDCCRWAVSIKRSYKSKVTLLVLYCILRLQYNNRKQEGVTFGSYVASKTVGSGHAACTKNDKNDSMIF
jgi:hypothetical protein